MGLFSRKKKNAASSAAEAARAQAQATAAQDAAARATREAAAKEAADKAAREKERAEEEKVLANIGAKRTDIEHLQNALNGFEQERRREAGLAIKARNEKRLTAAKAHMRNAARLKQRISNYETRLIANQSQLDALEDASFNKGGVKQMKDFKEDIEGLQQNPDEINDALQDMRDALNSVNDVNLTMQADANLNTGIYDSEDVLGDLDALEQEFGEETPVPDIPAVPGEKPTMPTAPVHSDPEEEQMRRLEAGI